MNVVGPVYMGIYPTVPASTIASMEVAIVHEGTEYGTVVINRTKLGTVHSVLYVTSYLLCSTASVLVSISAGVMTPVP